MGAREERGELTRETRNDGAEARQVDVYILITVSLIQETDPTIYFSLCDHVFVSDIHFYSGGVHYVVLSLR